MFTNHTIKTTLSSGLLLGLLAIGTSATARSVETTLAPNERAAQTAIAGNRLLSSHHVHSADASVSLLQNESAAKAAIGGSPTRTRSPNVIGSATLSHNEHAAQDVIVATPNHHPALAGAVARAPAQP